MVTAAGSLTAQPTFGGFWDWVLGPERLADSEPSLGEAVPDEAEPEALIEESIPLSVRGHAGLGQDVLLGGLSFVVHGVCTPLVERMRRWMPSTTPASAQRAITAAACAGELMLASMAARALSGPAEQLGQLIAQVPVLGGSHLLGQTLRCTLGSAVAQFMLTQGGAATMEAAPITDLYVANECALCLTPVSPASGGEGPALAALSCGHACLCSHGCAAEYLRMRDDCPMCRRSPVRVIHAVRC